MGVLPVPLPDERVTKEIEAGGKWVFGYLQRLIRLSETQTKHTGLIEAQAALIKDQAAEIAELSKKVAALEAREDVLMARADAAASRAAAQIVTDLARRIGHIEGSRVISPPD